MGKYRLVSCSNKAVLVAQILDSCNTLTRSPSCVVTIRETDWEHSIEGAVTMLPVAVTYDWGREIF